jgi:carbon-monoxide dehydrogenase iron sulfur subunit
VAQKVLMVDPSKCTGCRTCEMACSLYNEQKCSPVLSRIRIIKFEAKGMNFPTVCSHCSKPQCMSACPAGAIVRDNVTGAVSINETDCIGCRNCLPSCPFGQINFHPEKKVAFKCHLCGGDPVCVKYCPSGALTYAFTDEYMMSKRRGLHMKFTVMEG